jgi:hypothetical protein
MFFLPEAHMLNDESLRLLIRGKLHNGRLPQDGIRAAWGSPSDGETCNACDTVLARDQLLMATLGRRPLKMHVRCFQTWDQERRAT